MTSATSSGLSFQLAVGGHTTIALDIRDDDVDGLAAADHLVARVPYRMSRLHASFEAVPLPAASVDLAIFNASLHYALDLAAEESGHHTQRHPDQHPEHDRADADQHRRAGAVDQPGVEVTAEDIGAQPVRVRWPLQGDRQALRIRVLPGEQGGDDRDDRQDEDEEEPDQR